MTYYLALAIGHAQALIVATFQIGAQWHQGGRDQPDKSGIAEKFRKFPRQVFLYMNDIKCFEVSIMRRVKVNNDGDDFAHTQPGLSLAVFLASLDQLSMPLRYKCLAKIIDITK